MWLRRKAGGGEQRGGALNGERKLAALVAEPGSARQFAFRRPALNRFIKQILDVIEILAPAEVRGLYAYGDRVQVWCSDLKDGDDWYFLVDAETDLRIFDRVQLVVNANGTPGDFSDDTVEDAFFGCCSIDD